MTDGEHRPDSDLDLEVDAPTDASTSSGQPSEEESEALFEELASDDQVAEAEVLLERSDLEIALAERDEYLDALRRLQAEFENYRKRTVRQQSDLLGRAAESLIERLLPVLDALDLAVAHGQHPEVNAAELSEALQQISSLSRDSLAKEGLERIDAAEVPFDPTVHDAVAHVPEREGEAEQGVVVDEVLRSGYQLKGRVLRPAMVRVRG
jgi:molecular chaperone GrpE